MLKRTNKFAVVRALKERFKTIERCGLKLEEHISTRPLPGRHRRPNHFAIHYTPTPFDRLALDGVVECFICVICLDRHGNIETRWYEGKHYYGRCPADEEGPDAIQRYERAAPTWPDID